MDTEFLQTLPTETLQSVAKLTARLRVEQYLRALPTPMLRELVLMAESKADAAVLTLVQTELATRCTS